MVSWVMAALKQEQIPVLPKLSLSWKEQSSSSNLEQLSRELPICLCLKNKSPCVLCGARHRNMEEGRITDWYRGVSIRRYQAKSGGFHLAPFQNGKPQASGPQDEWKQPLLATYLPASCRVASSWMVTPLYWVYSSVAMKWTPRGCSQEWYFLTHVPVTHNTHFQDLVCHL